MPIVKEEIQQAINDLKGHSINNYHTLLARYAKEMDILLKDAGGLESNLPLTSEYFKIRNKYQYVIGRFKS